jgi:hypothetical protein
MLTRTNKLCVLVDCWMAFDGNGSGQLHQTIISLCEGMGAS